VTNSVSVVATVNFILRLLLASSMDRYMSMVNIMQIFVLYGLFEVSVTPEISSFFYFIMSIATFEILPENIYDYGQFFNFNTELEWSTRFDIMSFDSTSFIKILGFLFIILCFILAQFIFLGILKLLSLCCTSKKIDKWVKSLSKDLFWGTPLAFVIESYLDICLGCGLFLLGASPFVEYQEGDYIDSILCWFFAVMIVGVPAFVLIFLCKNKKRFRDTQRVKDKYLKVKKALKKRVKNLQKLEK
jgi:hypothetical protein